MMDRVPNATPLTPEEYQYCKNDVVILDELSHVDRRCYMMDNKFYDISQINPDKIYKIIKNCCVCGNELSGRFALHKVIKLHGNNRPVCDICTRRLSRLAHMTYKSFRRGDTLD